MKNFFRKTENGRKMHKQTYNLLDSCDLVKMVIQLLGLT